LILLMKLPAQTTLPRHAGLRNRSNQMSTPVPHEQTMHDPDSTLWLRILNGDQTAWKTLVRQYQPLVYTIATRSGLSMADAADCFQQTFVSLFENRKLSARAATRAISPTTMKSLTSLSCRTRNSRISSSRPPWKTASNSFRNGAVNCLRPCSSAPGSYPTRN
jgi:hypothetical protein